MYSLNSSVDCRNTRKFKVNSLGRSHPPTQVNIKRHILESVPQADKIGGKSIFLPALYANSKVKKIRATPKHMKETYTRV